MSWDNLMFGNKTNKLLDNAIKHCMVCIIYGLYGEENCNTYNIFVCVISNEKLEHSIKQIMYYVCMDICMHVIWWETFTGNFKQHNQLYSDRIKIIICKFFFKVNKSESQKIKSPVFYLLKVTLWQLPLVHLAAGRTWDLQPSQRWKPRGRRHVCQGIAKQHLAGSMPILQETQKKTY